MSLTPEEIATYTLKRAVRGYAIEDVDELLDRVADEVERLNLEIDDARQRLVTYEQRERDLADAEESVKRALLTATRAGDEALNEARERADAIVREAETEASRRLEEAERLAHVRRDEIEDEMGHHRDEVIRLVTETEARLERLIELDEGYRAAMRTTLIRAQRELDAMDENAAGRMGEAADALDAEPAGAAFDQMEEPDVQDHLDAEVAVEEDQEDDPWAPPAAADEDELSDIGDVPAPEVEPEVERALDGADQYGGEGEPGRDEDGDDWGPSGDRMEPPEGTGTTAEDPRSDDVLGDHEDPDDSSVRVIEDVRTKGPLHG